LKSIWSTLPEKYSIEDIPTTGNPLYINMTVDTATAVASLQSANDINSLKSAIEQALFLDGTPGDARQKLRGTNNYLVLHMWWGCVYHDMMTFLVVVVVQRRGPS